jgi:hypothetical protein
MKISGSRLKKIYFKEKPQIVLSSGAMVSISSLEISPKAMTSNPSNLPSGQLLVIVADQLLMS